MERDPVVDKVLVEWGESLFRRRRGGGDDEPRGGGPSGGRRAGSRGGAGVDSTSGGSGRFGAAAARDVGAAKDPLTANAVRRAIRDSIRPGAQQVLVKITGGGKGFKAMAAHLRYISRQGKEEVGGRGQTLAVTDERGDRHEGAAAVRRLIDDWRISGSYIPDNSPRKEAFHIIFSMPQGTRPAALQEAVDATAAQLFDGHRYAMALHLDQGAPHVHVMVRAENLEGVRLNPRKADLDRWRATFARELQARGVDAVATRQVARARNRAQPQLWQLKAREQGRLKRAPSPLKTGAKALQARREALQAWRHITAALAKSPDLADRALALEAVRYLARQAGVEIDEGRAVPRQQTPAGAEIPPRQPGAARGTRDEGRDSR